MKEKNYIRYRKLKAFGNSLCFYLCRILPVDRKLISVCTFEGKGGFGCNPKYIVKKLHEEHPEYKFVWFVNDMAKEFPDYIKKVPNTVWSRAYWLSRSKVWIDNYRKPYGTKKRKGQYYLNTWHGSIFIKPLGLLRGEKFSKMAYIVSENDSSMIDSLLMDSEWCVKIAKKAFLYDGVCDNIGMPRCDALYGDREEYRRKVHEKYNIPMDAKILMYAPTFRESANQGKRSVYGEVGTLDLGRLITNLEKKDNCKWYICLRVHPQIAAAYAKMNQFESDVSNVSDNMHGNRIINGSSEDDMYELLAGMDAYITDYSSPAFEAAYAHIPVLIYADDIETYAGDRGQLMWNIVGKNADRQTRVEGMDAPFPFEIATDNEMLEKLILNFDEEIFKKRIDKFKNDISLVFDGNASERAAKIIEEQMK